MKKPRILIATLIVGLCCGMTSCYSVKVAHGDMTNDDPVVAVHTEHNHYLIDGLVPIKNTQNAKQYIGNRKDYVVKTQQSFIDGLLAIITFRIYTPTTTTYYLPFGDVNNKDLQKAKSPYYDKKYHDEY